MAGLTRPAQVNACSHPEFNPSLNLLRLERCASGAMVPGSMGRKRRALASARASMSAENPIRIPNHSERKQRDGVISPVFPLPDCEMPWPVVRACVW
jgi:hypothetical protein